MQKKNESVWGKNKPFKYRPGVDLDGEPSPGTALLRDREIIESPQGASKARRMGGSPFWTLNNDVKEPRPRNFLCWKRWGNRTGSALLGNAPLPRLQNSYKIGNSDTL